MMRAEARTDAGADAGARAPVGPYALPPLRFPFDALEPAVGAEALRIHHEEHHRAHVEAINAALARHPEWHGLTIEDLLRRLPELPDDIRDTVREEGGGHANHQFFWKILRPHAPANPHAGPSGDLADAIAREWGSIEAFKAAFEEAGARHFGSGWVFLVVHPREGFRLAILTLPDAGSLLTLPEPAPGLLACDLWEHAYYLTHRNRRADWLRAWWGIVDWDVAGQRRAGVRAGRKQL